MNEIQLKDRRWVCWECNLVFCLGDRYHLYLVGNHETRLCTDCSLELEISMRKEFGKLCSLLGQVDCRVLQAAEASGTDAKAAS